MARPRRGETHTFDLVARNLRTVRPGNFDSLNIESNVGLAGGQGRYFSPSAIPAGNCSALARSGLVDGRCPGFHGEIFNRSVHGRTVLWSEFHVPLLLMLLLYITSFCSRFQRIGQSMWRCGIWGIVGREL